ncbi:MAG: branched-chain amino acid ABC transporter permease, partial [Thermotogaceae bacterium]|nr:branched-chain amino acid ABC transporter permease [Thermotogaceae bacterium]
MTWTLFLQHLVNGAALGFVFALVAIGYTLVYGVVKLVNFAHGDIFMMATFFVFYGITLFSLPWWLAFVIAIFLTILLGMGVEKVAYRPLRNAPRISSLCSAIGMSFLLENFAVVVFGGRQKPFYQPEVLIKTITIANVRIQLVSIVTVVVSIGALLFLNYLVYKTKMGLAMRALAHDFDTAKLMGINVDRTISFTFAVGSGLAAISAIFWALRYPQIWPFMGVFPGWRAFTAAIIGGIGSIKGAMIGGFSIGLLTILMVAFMPNMAGYKDAFIFVALVLILLF